MESKKLVMAGILLIVFSLGVVSAKSCVIQSPCNADNTVMKLSSNTNAHGSLYNQGSYNNFLCCDFTGTHSDSGSNKIIGLSSDTNAHAEIPTLGNYGTAVYFGDLECTSNSGSCLSGYDIPMISLSDNTNAHIGGFNDYSIKICCCAPGKWEWTDDYQCAGDTRQRKQRRTLCPSGYDYQWVDDACPSGQRCIGSGQCVDNCIFTNAYWSQSSASEGENVQMILEGTNCDGKSVSFEIWEDDLTNDDFMTTISGVFDRGAWTAQWQDDGAGNPEYYFIATLDAYTDMTRTSGLLDLEREIYWADMDGNEISKADFGDTVQMIITWAESGTFEIKEEDIINDDEIEIVAGASVGDDVIAKWTITQEDLDKTSDYDEFYFRVDGGEKSSYLKINTNKNDKPTDITVLSPECGSYFDEGTEIIINVSASDADDVIDGTISIDGSAMKTFGNGGAALNRVFDSPGNFQIVIETISNRGGRARMISNIMILDKDAGNYVDGRYVAACITKPKDFSYIDGGEVKFDASATRAVRVTSGVIDLLVPDEGDVFSWYWKFMPENVVREFIQSSDPAAYRFTAEFPIAGDNSATLRVEID